MMTCFTFLCQKYLKNSKFWKIKNSIISEFKLAFFFFRQFWWSTVDVNHCTFSWSTAGCDFITPNENLISIQRTKEKVIKKIILQLYFQQPITRSSTTSTAVPWPTLTTAPKNVKVRVEKVWVWMPKQDCRKFRSSRVKIFLDSAK